MSTVLVSQNGLGLQKSPRLHTVRKVLASRVVKLAPPLHDEAARKKQDIDWVIDR